METNGPEAKSGSMTNTARPSCAEPAGSSGGSAAARFIGIRKRRWPGCGNFWKTRASIPTIEIEVLPQRHRDTEIRREGRQGEGGTRRQDVFPLFHLSPLSSYLCVSVPLWLIWLSQSRLLRFRPSRKSPPRPS